MNNKNFIETFEKLNKLYEDNTVQELESRKNFIIEHNTLVDVINKNITFARVPNGIIKIGPQAFEHCKELETIILPEGLKIISSYAFRNCKKLKKIVLPESVIEVQKFAFSMCRSLESIILSNNITSIGKRAFWGCYNIKQLVLPPNLDRIEEALCAECRSLEHVAIPNGVYYIGRMAFCCTNIKQIFIPYSVDTIYGEAFAGCKNLKEVEISSNVTTLGKDIFGVQAIRNKDLVIKTANQVVINYCNENNIAVEKIDEASSDANKQIFEKSSSYIIGVEDTDLKQERFGVSDITAFKEILKFIRGLSQEEKDKVYLQWSWDEKQVGDINSDIIVSIYGPSEKTKTRTLDNWPEAERRIWNTLGLKYRKPGQ